MGASAKHRLNRLASEIIANPEKNKRKRYDKILAINDWTGINRQIHLALAGYLFNTSQDLGDSAGLDRVIEVCKDRLDRFDLCTEHKYRTYYQLSNAYSYRHHLSSNTPGFSFFDSDDYLNAIIYHRKALTPDGLQQTPNNQQCRLYTNFGNLLSHLGREVEAMEYWGKALQIDSSFEMALGNRGLGKYRYGAMIPDPGHASYVLGSAYEDLNKSLESNSLRPQPREVFQRTASQLESMKLNHLEVHTDPDQDSCIGETTDEIKYRKWCLFSRLFLNPLNDVTTRPGVAHDCLHLPPITTGINESLPYPGLYNQMKQEFASARYMFFDGLSAQKSHFSDKGVKLADTYDSPVYGYATEQMKAALRLAYSIYEKIAYFLNGYYSLGLGNTGFSHVWYTDGERGKGLHDKFESSHNWPLNALFWVKKDFYGGPLDVSESVEEIPATAEEIRHALEHRYLSVHDEGGISTGDDAEDWFNDDLKEQITRSQLVASGLEMLKTARRGLIYLSLAVHYEERKGAESDVDPGKIAQLESRWIDDKLKL